MGDRHLDPVDCYPSGALERERFQPRPSKYQINFHARAMEERQHRAAREELVGDIGVAVAQSRRGEGVSDGRHGGHGRAARAPADGNDGGTFVDATDQAGVVDGGWGWAACAIDFENDGDLDIYHTNGWVGLGSTVEADYTADRSRAFVNAGDGTFTDRAGPLGLDDAELGRAAVCADFDNDGDVDILLLHEGATLWENQTAGAQFLGVRLRGLPPNTQAVGARITVRTTHAGQTRSAMRELTLGSNYLSQNPLEQVFGLGAATACDVEIEWPDGTRTRLSDVAAGQTLHVSHPALR